MPEEGYDPNRSKVSDSTMENWKNTTTTGDLSEVPGIGAATIQKLSDLGAAEDNITNTYQLFGQFLMLKGPGDVDPMEHTERFWWWLKNRGINAHRSAIVRAIAEKSATFFQGIYDANAYEEDEEDSDDDGN